MIFADHHELARPAAELFLNPPPCPSPTRGEGTLWHAPSSFRGTCGRKLIRCHHLVAGVSKGALLRFPPPLWGRDREGGYERAREGATSTHHIFSLAFVTTSDHRVVSSASSRLNVSPGVVVVSKPSAASLSFMSGSAAIASAAV